MTELLEKVKQKIAQLSQRIETHNDEYRISIFEEKLSVYEDLLPNISSLITTIESQKEEIEKLQKPALSLAYRVLKQKHEQDAESYIEHIFKIESEIESLKAITELAVKGLERISVTFERGEMVRLAYEHLHKIKELSHE